MRITSRSKLSDLHFRDIVGRFFYLECPDLLNPERFRDMPVGTTGEIIYGYIDPNVGISFQACSYATRKDDEVFTTLERQQYNQIIRYLMIRDNDVAELDYDFTKDDLGLSFSTEIDRQYATDELTMELREDEFLDPFRHTVDPDVLKVLLISKGHTPEQVWAYPNALEDDGLFGELLNQPYQDLGINIGDRIKILAFEMDDGTPVCASLL